MKEGWEYKRLGDVATYINGFAFKPQDWTQTGMPIIRIQTLTESKGTTNRCQRTDIPEKYRVRKGDILISWSATLGVFEWLKEDAWLNQHIFKVVFDRTDIYKYYLKYAVNASLAEMATKTNGATMKHIRKGEFDNILIPVPPRPEQQRIVTYLDSAFAKIDQLKENAAKALSEAKALFQAELKKCMEKKEGWEEKMLGDIAIDSADGPFGSNLKKEHYTTEKQVRIIQLSNIGEEGWREENTKYTTFDHLKTICRSEVLPNDIVIAKMMPAGRAIICPNHETKYVLSSDAVKVKLKEGIDTRFALYSINSSYFRNQVYENVSGSGRVRTSLTKLRLCKLYLPDIATQQSIVSHLNTLSEKVKQLEANYTKTIAECDALKQAILKETFE